MKYECSKERSNKDISGHTMTVIRNNGTDRHLRFKSPGTICYSFDVITWPGHLCITGDCGTYVFSRDVDMFEFFWKSDGSINPCYWGEKLLSIGTNAGYEKYCHELFKENINDYIKNYFEFDDDEEERIVLKEVKEQIINDCYDGEIRSYDSACNFESSFGHQFNDFEPSCKKYTFRYIWNLYAIVHAIKTFRELPEIAQ